MPGLRLVPKEATLSLQSGDQGSFATNRDKKNDELVFKPTFTEKLSYSVVAQRRRDVRLATEEQFGALEGSVTLQRAEEPNTDKAVGVLRYLRAFESRDGLESEPASYAVHCAISPLQFDELVIAARAGRLPSLIALEVAGEGGEMGWEPDGSGFEWDNKTHPGLAIAEIGFILPLVLPAAADDYDLDEAVVVAAAPASHAQMGQLIQKVDKLQELTKQLLWVVAVFAVLLLVRSAW